MIEAFEDKVNEPRKIAENVFNFALTNAKMH